MTKPRHLTPEKEDEIIRRVELSAKCGRWLDENGVSPTWAKRGFNATAVSRLVRLNSTTLLSDEELKDLKRLYRHTQKVRKIQNAHGRKLVRKEYGISDERISSLLRMKRYDFRGKSIADFLTRKLTNNPQPSFYY